MNNNAYIIGISIEGTGDFISFQIIKGWWRLKHIYASQVKGSRESTFDKQMQLFYYSDQTDSEIRTNNNLAFRSKKERTIKFDCTKQTDDTRLLTFQYSQYTLH